MVSAVPPPRPATAANIPPVLKQGIFSFEAERLAMQNGCTTPSGIRPVANLIEEFDTLQTYAIACQQGNMSVRCENDVCELER